MEYFYGINTLIETLDNQKLILKNCEGAEFSLAHTGLKLSQVTRNEKLD